MENQPGNNLENINSWEGKTPHQVLGVPTDATKEQISKAFKELSLKYHTDKVHFNKDLYDNYLQVQQIIGGAYAALTNPPKNEPVKPRANFCGNCGKRVEYSWKYCDACGMRI